MKNLSQFISESSKYDTEFAEQLKTKFIEELGWNKWDSAPYEPFSKGPRRFKLIPVAQRSNVDVLVPYDTNAIFTIRDITDNIQHGSFLVILRNNPTNYVIGFVAPGYFDGKCVDTDGLEKFLDKLKFDVLEETTVSDVIEKIKFAMK